MLQPYVVYVHVCAYIRMCVCVQDMVQLMSVDRRNTAVSPVDSLKQLRERLRKEREEAVRMIHAGECRDC